MVALFVDTRNITSLINLYKSMKMRINLFGGPGVGKTTLAAQVFAELRRQKVVCSLVPEWIKTWAYQGRPIRGFDQVFSFSNQLHMEEEAIRYTNLIITDSPLFLQCMYSDKHAPIVSTYLWDIAITFESCYPSINFFVQRSGGYESHGRYESEVQALEMDDYIISQLKARNIPTNFVQRDDVKSIIDVIGDANE